MEGDSHQFDSLLGGTENLPQLIIMRKFISYRQQEVQVMKKKLITQSGTKLVFQTLPKHMRRRAMSHNVKRLPRRLRQIHLKQMTKSGLPIKQKTPSRKYRRRPKNLLVEYTRRSNNKHKWLQTHIWHAKRFHMVEKWGFKLACHPRDKAYRANYRAMAKHCLLQDISYVRCIEIEGQQEIIVEKMKIFHHHGTGLSVGAKAFINGNREGEMFMYDNDKPIGSINFHWIPNPGHISKLWIWCHPAIFSQVLQLMQNQIKNSKNLTLRELDEDLARFRLTGPLATSILNDAFILPTNFDEIIAKTTWAAKITNHQAVKNQLEFWQSLKNLNSVADVSPHLILSLIVQDPRYNLPKKRIKCVPNDSEPMQSIQMLDDLMCSPLYSNEIRKQLNENVISNAEIAKMRSELLVPGSTLTKGMAFTSILLIQRPGNKHNNIGFGSGWDVIVPRIWARPLWIALVMRGAKVGGLRETNSILFEMGKPFFLPPDTEAGQQNEEENNREKRTKYFRMPPNKRTNYNKFNIVSPFECNWRLLMQDWTSNDQFLVLRNNQLLGEINDFLHGKCRNLPQLPKNLLVPIKLVCIAKGSPKKCAIICIPNEKDDLKKAIVESILGDRLQEERKRLRKSHKALLKKLRKRRKLKLKINENDLNEINKYTEKIRGLWLPQAKTIQKSCSRDVCGFVQTGGFSLSLGKSSGVGYIVAESLNKFIKFKRKNLILFRNTDSREYKVAKFSIIMD